MACTQLQFAALPLRYNKHHQLKVLLITSRGSGRWLPPKGCEMPGLPCHRCAEIEALEEAGVVGVLPKKPLGRYHLAASRQDHRTRPEVVLYPMAVQAMLKQWKECNERTRRWFSLKGAANAVQEPELQAIILSLKTNRMIANLLQ